MRGVIILWRVGSKSFCHMSHVVNVAKLVDFVICLSYHYYRVPCSIEVILLNKDLSCLNTAANFL